MALALPNFHSPRGQGAITISSDSSTSHGGDGVATITISSDSSTSHGGDEAKGGQKSVLRHGRPPSPAPSALPVLSPTVVTAASFARHVATGRRTTAAAHESPSPCSVLSVSAPGSVAPTPPPGGGGGGDYDEATSRPKRKARYRKWELDDERKILDTLAQLSRDNLGVQPQASVLLAKIHAIGGLCRRGVDATELSDKVYKLKKKFVKGAAKVAARSGGRRRFNNRDRVLYQACMEVWPNLLPRGVADSFELLLA